MVKKKFNSGGKFDQNYEQTLLLFSSQPPPLFALSLQLDAVKKNLMFVSQKESTEVNAIRVFITDTLLRQAWALDSSLKTLYNSSLASQCGTTTVESGH